MKLLDGDALEGEICPECVLIGPRGAAARVRERLAAIGGNDGTPEERKEGATWARLLIQRARLLEAAPAFPLAARQAAVRETRERR